MAWQDTVIGWWDEFRIDLVSTAPNPIEIAVVFARLLGLLLLGWIIVKVVGRIHIPINRWMRRRFEVVVEARVVRSLLTSVTWFVIIYLMIRSIPGIGQQTASFLSAGLAIIVAFSSQSIIANAMNGLMIRMVKPYKVGDLVEIARDGIGVVTHVGLLYTRVQDAKNRIITIPNQHVLSEGVVNYSNTFYVAHCEVGLGYDVNRWEVEKALKRAAVKVGLKKPSLMIRLLGDYAINYEINGTTEDVTNFITIESQLRLAVIDELHAAEIEITSPIYHVNRQVAKGKDSTIPAVQVKRTIRVEEGVTAQLSKAAIAEVEKKVEQVEREEAGESVATSTDSTPAEEPGNGEP